jgi:hypothetical protein
MATPVRRIAKTDGAGARNIPPLTGLGFFFKFVFYLDVAPLALGSSIGTFTRSKSNARSQTSDLWPVFICHPWFLVHAVLISAFCPSSVTALRRVDFPNFCF